IRGHRKWDKNIVSYKLDQSPAVILYLEVEHQKRFSARNFIEISCSLIASTGASLQLIKMDESRDTMALKRFYMRNLYDKDMNIEDWNNLSEENLEKSIVEDLCKTYSANHWKVIKELFKILGFTGINDKRVLPGNIISEAFIQSCKRFIEI
ncbi:18066_t:CDS:2, partial [Funneliformis geosporum]